jgi:hypothetical protein
MRLVGNPILKQIGGSNVHILSHLRDCRNCSQKPVLKVGSMYTRIVALSLHALLTEAWQHASESDGVSIMLDNCVKRYVPWYLQFARENCFENCASNYQEKYTSEYEFLLELMNALVARHTSEGIIP